MKIDFTHIIAVLIVAVVIFMMGTAFYSVIQNDLNKIDCGVIVDTDYSYGYTRYTSDKHGGHMYSYPDTYTFTIEGEKDGKTVRYTFEVTEQEYNRYRIGDWYER